VGELRYDSPLTRPLMVLFQVALWIIALAIVLRLKVPAARRSQALVTNETLIDLSDPAVVGATTVPTTGETDSADADGSASADEVER
jgi:septal ring-binding cell division protein DamX